MIGQGPGLASRPSTHWPSRCPLPQDHDAALYLTHRAALLDYAASLTGSRAQAEDLVQDAYLRFVPPQPERGPTLNPVAYLYRIVRNLAWDQARRRGGEQRRQQDPAFWMRPAEARTPEQESIHRQEVEAVAAVLAALPERSRMALEMRRFGGHTLEEIARHLGVSVPTAHRLVHGALLRVAAALDRDPA